MTVFQEMEEERITYLRNYVWLFSNTQSATIVQNDQVLLNFFYLLYINIHVINIFIIIMHI